MNDPDAKLVQDPDDHAYLIQRLGSAVVACWTELPREIQDKLLAHTGGSLGEGEMDDSDPRLQLFVGSHLRKPG